MSDPDVERLIRRARGIRHKPHISIQRKVMGGWITLQGHDRHRVYVEACNWAIDALAGMDSEATAELRVISSEGNLVLWPPEMAGQSIWKDS